MPAERGVFVMGPIAAVYTAFVRSFSYFGRASRSEFIWFALFCVLGYVALEVLQSKIWGWSLKDGPNVEILTSAFPYIIGLPAIALSVRRIQDIGLHPIILAIPFILRYTSLYMQIGLAKDFGHFVGLNWDAAGRADNVISIFARFISSG